MHSHIRWFAENLAYAKRRNRRNEAVPLFAEICFSKTLLLHFNFFLQRDCSMSNKSFNILYLGTVVCEFFTKGQKFRFAFIGDIHRSQIK